MPRPFLLLAPALVLGLVACATDEPDTADTVDTADTADPADTADTADTWRSGPSCMCRGPARPSSSARRGGRASLRSSTSNCTASSREVVAHIM